METHRETALLYHGQTCHSRSRIDGAGLDWSDQPDVFKRYPDADSLPLIPVAELCRKSLWGIVSEKKDETGPRQLDLGLLSDIIAMGNGITLKRDHGGTLYTFRSAASAGALYPVEVYVDIINVEGVPQGLYHVNIRDFSLERLRKKPNVSRKGTRSSARIFLTGIFYRSAWKYGKRAYRYILNDLGHVSGNILLSAGAHNLNTHLSYDFPDEAVNAYLGLNPTREVCLAHIDLGMDPTQNSLFHTSIHRDMQGPIACQASPVSRKNVSYPNVLGIHQSGMMASLDGNPRKDIDCKGLIQRVTRWESVTSASPGIKGKGLGESILNRRSRRNFVDEVMAKDHAMSLIDLVSRTWRLIRAKAGCHPGFLPGFVCSRQGAMVPGFYLINPDQNQYGLVEEGLFMNSMAGACLDQMWLKMAGFHFLMLSELASLDDAMGPRGYRHVMMNAGLLGQVIYLGAVSLGLGCCGIGAYYDDEVSRILDLDEHEYLLYLVAAGRVKSGFL